MKNEELTKKTINGCIEIYFTNRRIKNKIGSLMDDIFLSLNREKNVGRVSDSREDKKEISLKC